MPMNESIELGNGEERAQQNPHTFEIPPLEVRKALKVGDSAKLMFLQKGTREGERMWVEVSELTPDGRYIGVIDNDPFVFKGVLHDRDSVAFGPEHVINVMRKGVELPKVGPEPVQTYQARLGHERKSVPNKSAEALKQFITDVLERRIFLAHHVPDKDQHMVGRIFMPILLGACGDIDPASVGTVFEYTDQAAPLGVNGYPCFMTVQFLSKDDWLKAKEIITLEQRRRKDVLDALIYSASTPAPDEDRHG